MAESGGVYYGRSSQMTEERMRDAAEKAAKQRALREDLEAQMQERRRVLEATGITPLSDDVPIGTAALASGMTKAQRRRQQMLQERQALASAPSNDIGYTGGGGGGGGAGSSGVTQPAFVQPQAQHPAPYYGQQQQYPQQPAAVGGGPYPGYAHNNQNYPLYSGPPAAAVVPQPWPAGAQQHRPGPYIAPPSQPTSMAPPPTAPGYHQPQHLNPHLVGHPHQQHPTTSAPPQGESIYGWLGAGGGPARAPGGPPPTAPTGPPPAQMRPSPPQPQTAHAAAIASPRGAIALPSVHAPPSTAPFVPPTALTQEQLLQLLSRATDQIYESRLGTAPQQPPPSSAYHEPSSAISPMQRDVESRRATSKRDQRGAPASRAKSRERGGTAPSAENPVERQKAQRLATDLAKHQQAMDKLQEQAKDWEQEVSQLRQQLKNAKMKEKELQKMVQSKQPKTANGPHHRAETAPNNGSKGGVSGQRRPAQLDPLAAQAEDSSGAAFHRPITAPQSSTSPVPPPQPPPTTSHQGAPGQLGTRGRNGGAPVAGNAPTSVSLPALVVPSIANMGGGGDSKFAQKKWLASPRDPPPPKTAGTVVVASPTSAAAPSSPTKLNGTKAPKSKGPLVANLSPASLGAPSSALAPQQQHTHPLDEDDNDGDSPLPSSSHEAAVAVSLTRLAQFATVDQIITHAQANLLWSHFATRIASKKNKQLASSASQGSGTYVSYAAAAGGGSSGDAAGSLHTYETFEELQGNEDEEEY